MEIFEIHITGSKNILNFKEVKTISVELLKPDKTVLRTEYMTSHVMKKNNFDTCLLDTKAFVHRLENLGVSIVRVKIECPYYEHYKDVSKYIESHFETENNIHPLSRNTNKRTFLGTDRTYNHDEYDNFREKYKGSVIELCLYDSFVAEDQDWFNLYLIRQPKSLDWGASVIQ